MRGIIEYARGRGSPAQEVGVLSLSEHGKSEKSTSVDRRWSADRGTGFEDLCHSLSHYLRSASYNGPDQRTGTSRYSGLRHNSVKPPILLLSGNQKTLEQPQLVCDLVTSFVFGSLGMAAQTADLRLIFILCSSTSNLAVNFFKATDSRR